MLDRLRSLTKVFELFQDGRGLGGGVAGGALLALEMFALAPKVGRNPLHIGGCVLTAV